MPRSFLAEVIDETDGITTLQVRFGEPATNAQIVPDAIAAIGELRLGGGRGIKVTGAISVPAAFALAHAVAHVYGFVACYDPKLARYVVAISHDPAARPGDLME